jgi:hypothetical protein
MTKLPVDNYIIRDIDRQIHNFSREEVLAVYKLLKNRLNQIELKAGNKFYPGAQVKFKTKDGSTLKGTVQKVNRKTVIVKTLTSVWKVSPSRLEEFV